MSGIDRRTLIGVLGAGIVGSAAQAQKFSRSSTIGAISSQTPTTVCFNLGGSNPVATGTFPPWEVPGITIGPDGRRRPAGYPAGASYDPQYSSLVYLQFAIGMLKVRHAHFEKRHVDTADKIKSKFIQMRTTPSTLTDYVAGSLGENFDSWTFGSQSRIYIFIDNDTVKFDPENLVQFSWFSARKEIGQKPLRAMNNTFLNPMIDTSIYPPYEVLIMENWYCDVKGKPVETNNREKFSMNVHLKMQTYLNDVAEGFNDVPIVLDPDTGNMGSIP